ncbi:MAG: rod-binding protein [Phenylobacterium sp.]|uniref:rod-binding protein n=1 Tax=Phenylobacterium sp. TaxID=1871053 RepID=UPI001A55C496|nr:rod-binding protein [Phenylobacterium sp.]MBL8769740.1 rod-binding protein [Phenylobacterium sp.]
MSDLSAPIALSPTLLAATPQQTAADLAKSRAKDAAQKFEAQFLSTMFQQMFSGLKTDGPFGGGTGEEMFRSLMTEAMGKQVAKAGGIGLADTVQREILKLQGLT